MQKTLTEGCHVWARYQGGDYYKGNLTKKNPDGTWFVTFYDGDIEANCPTTGIRFLAQGATTQNLKPGLKVWARYKGGKDSYSGTIESVNAAASTADILFDDGDRDSTAPFSSILVDADWESSKDLFAGEGSGGSQGGAKDIYDTICKSFAWDEGKRAMLCSNCKDKCVICAKVQYSTTNEATICKYCVAFNTNACARCKGSTFGGTPGWLCDGCRYRLGEKYCCQNSRNL